MALSPQTTEALKVGRHRIAMEEDPGKLAELRELYDGFRWQAALEDPWYFLTRVCKTKNELLGEYEPFPEYPYLAHMLAQWQKTDAKPSGKLHLTAKSRQIMASWFACAMVLYRCMSGKAVRVGWQGKKAEDTNEMLERIFGLWDRMPDAIKKAIPCERRFLHLHFPTTDSDVHAIPQGPDQVRQYTWRYFISDEMAFQENAEEAYYALLPALGAQGMLWVISTAAPGHFETLYSSPALPDTYRKLNAGMETWVARNGITILRLHWKADPKKSEEWAEMESAKYGGRLAAFWRSEYEIDFGARRGGLVFPQFARDTHTIPPIEPALMESWPKWRVIDPGYNNATAVGFYTTHDDVLYLYDELYLTGKPVAEIAAAIKAKSGKTRFEYTLIDPSAFAHTLSAAGRSVADLFNEQGITVNPAYRASHKRDQIPAAAELLKLNEIGQPRFKAVNTCENFVREILGYRWREARDDQPTPEEPVKKDDHLIDCFAAGTVIQLERGPTPIEDVVAGDMAWTRVGFRRVREARATRPKALWRADLADGGAIVTTESHPVWTENRGWVPFSRLTPSDMLLQWDSNATSTEFASTASGIGSIPDRCTTVLDRRTSCAASTSSIETCGGPRTVRSQRGWSSTIAMAIRSITPSATSNSCSAASTRDITAPTGRSREGRGKASIWSESGRRPLHGIEARPVEHGIARTASPHGATRQRRLPSAGSVARREVFAFAARQSGVLRAARRRHEGGQESMTKSVRAPIAAGHSAPTATPRSAPALAPARIVSAPRPTGRVELVYNLAVEGAPEYIADGILVHNCFLYAAAAINPKHYANKIRDPLQPWYGGGNWERRQADMRRARSAMMSGEEP